MAELSYKHFFKVEDNKIIFDDKEMLNYEKRKLEGKRGYVTIHEDEEKPTINQFAYYWGVLIRKYCVNTNSFAAMTEYEIHEYFLMELRSTAATVLKKNGRARTIVVPGEFDKIRRSKKRLAEFITEVIALLNVDFEIYPDPPDHFTNPKFRVE